MPNFKMSKNIGFQVEDVEKAQHFYESILGLRQSETKAVEEVEFRTEHNSIYLIPGIENLGPVMEFYVNDLEEAKQHLIQDAGRQSPSLKNVPSDYVRDPFGMVFNVWEEK